MSKNPKYLVIDIGTGNVRVAITDTSGRVLHLATDDVIYHTDKAYTDSIYFEPDQLWEQILTLTKQVISPEYAQDIIAVSSSSQREGIVVLDHAGNSLLGMPNIDHRGREYENILPSKDRVYQLTGRYPTSLFSAFKVYGLTKKRPEIGNQVTTFVSISEWAIFKVSGALVYEHAQASETLLYDVEQRTWSQELCNAFEFPLEQLPKLVYSGTTVGSIDPVFADQFGLNHSMKVIVGGADTQLAIESTLPAAEDIVLVSGTTTPIVKIIDKYLTDSQQRTWTNSHTTENAYILETNAGVTGLNYQRFKSIFYPNEGYEILEQEVLTAMQSTPQCYAALGSLLCEEKSPLLKGGFIIPTPLTHTLTRGHFAFALLWDLACSIYENYRSLIQISSHPADYVWACGGGMQSQVLRQLLANLLQKEIRVQSNYRQATVTGCAFVCNRALGILSSTENSIASTFPDPTLPSDQWYQAWKDNRSVFKNNQL